MADTARRLTTLTAVLAISGLAACASESARLRPTAPPVIQITPAPTQNVAETATTFARRIMPTPTAAGLYIVKPGDTLTKIADEHETTIDEIMALNNLSDPDTIVVGQRLILPSPDATPEISTTREASPEASAEPATTSAPEATAEASPGMTAAP